MAVASDDNTAGGGMGEWISVDERLPPKAEPGNYNEVLVWCENKRDVFKGWRMGSEHETWWACYPGSATEAHVTHWMPLPEPPTTQRGE